MDFKQWNKTFERYIGVFRATARCYREGGAIEKAQGFIPKEDLHRILCTWANEVLELIRVEKRVSGAPQTEDPVIFVSNHLSYVDIPLLMSIAPVVFVSKVEVKRWPIIGPASRRAGTVFVKRSSSKSRQGAGQSIAEALTKEGLSVGIFPAGTTSIGEIHPWRKGAFVIAKDYNLKVQPIRISYEPTREVAYIDKDALVTHLWRLFKLPKIIAKMEFGEPLYVTDPEEQAKKLWDWAREPIAKESIG